MRAEAAGLWGHRTASHHLHPLPSSSSVQGHRRVSLLSPSPATFLCCPEKFQSPEPLEFTPPSLSFSASPFSNTTVAGEEKPEPSKLRPPPSTVSIYVVITLGTSWNLETTDQRKKEATRVWKREVEIQRCSEQRLGRRCLHHHRLPPFLLPPASTPSCLFSLFTTSSAVHRNQPSPSLRPVTLVVLTPSSLLSLSLPPSPSNHTTVCRP